jgi:nucleoside-diphosphate-sugar epimerase
VKTVLVTGGSGLVGRFIVDDLAARGWQVTIAGRREPPPGSFAATVRYSRLDLDPSTDYQKMTAGYDALVHAGFSHVAGRYRGGEGRDIIGFWDRNFLSTLLLFQAAQTSGVRRAVFLSSRAVYGRQPPGDPLSEETVCRPDSHYGLIKLACEQYLEKAARSSQLCASSLRVTGVYGLSSGHSINKWSQIIDDYLVGRPVSPRFGTEVHGRDVASAVRLMLESPTDGVCGQVFNVSDLALDRHDLLSLVRDRCGCSHPLPARAEAVGYNVMNTVKLQQLGWKPGGEALFRQTVRHMIDTAGDQPSSS